MFGDAALDEVDMVVVLGVVVLVVLVVLVLVEVVVVLVGWCLSKSGRNQASGAFPRARVFLDVAQRSHPLQLIKGLPGKKCVY